jgi:hypothetical protein
LSAATVNASATTGRSGSGAVYEEGQGAPAGEAVGGRDGECDGEGETEAGDADGEGETEEADGDGEAAGLPDEQATAAHSASAVARAANGRRVMGATVTSAGDKFAGG